MRTFKLAVIMALMVGLSFGAYAELQNVLVNGSIRIRGNYLDYDELTVPANVVPGRVVLGDEAAWVEQRTRLG